MDTERNNDEISEIIVSMGSGRPKNKWVEIIKKDTRACEKIRINDLLLVWARGEDKI